MKKWLDASGKTENVWLWNAVWEDIGSHLDGMVVWDTISNNVYAPTFTTLRTTIENPIKDALEIRHAA